MVSFTLAAVAGLLATANALPQSVSPPPVTPPAGIVQTKGSFDPTAIMAAPLDSFTMYNGRPNSTTDEAASPLDKRCDEGTSSTGSCCTTSGGSVLDWGDSDGGGWGITIQNADTTGWRGFYFYEYGCDGKYPYKYTWVGPGATVFITLPYNFNGQMTRGIDSQNLVGNAIGTIPATWLEFNWDVRPAWMGIWADVSVIRGNDGGILAWCPTTSSWVGFTQDIDSGADAWGVRWVEKPDGAWVLSPTEDTAEYPAEANTDAYELSAIGTANTYIDDAHTQPSIFCPNGRLGVYVPLGYP